MKNKKSEKGAISILVLVSLVLFSTFLMSTYIIISNKVKTQKEIIEETKKIYEVETEEEAYNSFFANQNTFIPIYTNEQYLNIGTGNTIGINGKYYNFAEDASYILMNNLEIEEDELPENWTAPEIFFRSNNEGNINYSNHIVKIKYNDNSEEIYNGEKQLPHEYEEVEYIESTGTQYIDTEFTPTANTKWILDVQFMNTNQQFNGVYNGDRFDIAIGSTGMFYLNIENTYDIFKADTERHMFILDAQNQKGYIDNNEYDIPYTSLSFNGRNILIGARKANNVEYPCNERIYGSEIYENGVLIRKLIPCYRKIDKQVGLFDIKNNKFYQSKNNMNFLLPYEKFEDWYKKIAYIETNGSQYINTKITPTANTKWILDVQFMNTNQQFNGVYNGDRFDIAIGSTGMFYLNIENTYDIFKADTERHMFILDAPNQKAYIDNDEYDTQYTSLSFGGRNILIGARQAANVEYPCNERIYGSKIYENGELVRNLIPCQRLDGINGLYDLVEGAFYINCGTGTFIAGPEV